MSDWEEDDNEGYRAQEKDFQLPLRKPTHVWLVASKAHGRTVRADQRYPHICGLEVPDVEPVNGRQPVYGRRECLACQPGGDRPAPLLDWDPYDGYSTEGTLKTKVEWQWGCPICRTTGAADSEANAHGLTALHLRETCPGTAVVYYRASDPECYVYRVARHQRMHQLYPESVPAWKGKSAYDKTKTTGHLPTCAAECRRRHILTAEDLAPLGALAALD